MSHKIGEKFDRISMLHVDYANRQVGARVQHCVCTEEGTGEIAEDAVVKSEDMVWYPWDEFFVALPDSLARKANVEAAVLDAFARGRAAHEVKMEKAKTEKK